MTTFENRWVSKIYLIVLIPVFDTTYKKINRPKNTWAINQELVLFLQSRNCFCYVPEIDIEGDILGWNPFNITDRKWRQTKLMREKTFSSNKDQQRFRNRSYRCDDVKVENTLSVTQQLLYKIQNGHSISHKEPSQLWVLIN